jgi:hypothetical protein
LHDFSVTVRQKAALRRAAVDIVMQCELQWWQNTIQKQNIFLIQET